jgi:ABC-type uncharacterized transport system ATPase subunit
MYILDEPSIGLHQRDNQRLLDTLHRLRDLGNTVIVVEHDEDAIRQAGLAEGAIAVVPAVKRGCRNAELIQGAADRQMGAFDQADDL